MSDPKLSSTASRQWLPAIVRLLIICILLVLIAGFLYQNISEARDRRFHPMPGRLVDVGGYKLHINCTGEGSPAVVLDSGLGDSFLVWRKVKPEIAQFTRVCSYDRAGLGFSDPSPRPRTSQVIAEELHTLLHRAGVAVPVVLVGHSAGGFNIRVFTSLYRNEVAGLVLVGSSHPDQTKRFPLALNDMEATWLRESEFLEFTMPFGLPRLLGFCSADGAVRATDCTFNSARERVAELRAFPASAAQAASTGPFGDLPVAVLSQDPDHPEPDLPPDLVKPTRDARETMQEELVHLSTRGTRTVAKNSSHYIQIDRPDLVIAAVRDIVSQAREDQARATPK